VKADRIQIEQVLNNLVANAIDVASERTDARGLVVMRVSRRSDRIVIHVEDNERIADSVSDTAVIMITGYADVPTAVSAMKIGAFHFVQKPFDVEALLITVEEALARAAGGRDHQAEIQEFRTRCALLTQREQEVLTLLVEGLSTKLISHRLGITPRTTEHHRAAVMQKMEARTIFHLVRMALSLGRQ
jgi:FixJ family two-component response regulator